MNFKGTHTALVTPFKAGRIDAEAFEMLIERQVEAGIEGLVPCGTTGESPVLSHDEHNKVIELCVRRAKGRALVIAGTGSNSTDEAISMTQTAERVGVDASLQVCPYYNKPPQEGLYRHFKAIAVSTDLPILLYSIPGRATIEIAVETIDRLRNDCPNIVGIKEAGGRVERVKQIREVCGTDFVILSGDDVLTLPFLREGAEGVISVASNFVPKEVGDMVRSFLAGNESGAEQREALLKALFRDLFLETNPIPVKAALAMKGWIEEEYRLPLLPMSKPCRDQLEATLRAGGWL